jgi:hypothetical protein
MPAGAGRLFPVSPTSGRRGAYGCSTPARPSDRFSLASPVLDLTLFWTPRTRIKSCWSCSVCCAIDQSKRSRGRIGVSDPLENMYVKTGRRQALRAHVSSSYRPAHAAAVNLPILHGLQSNGSGCVLLREWTAKSEMGDSVCLHFGVRVNVLPTALVMLCTNKQYRPPTPNLCPVAAPAFSISHSALIIIIVSCGCRRRSRDGAFGAGPARAASCARDRARS